MILAPGIGIRSVERNEKFLKRRENEVEVLHEFMYSIDNFLSENECKSWINYGNQTGFEHSNQPATRYTALRQHDRIQIDSKSTADALFTRLLPSLPPVIDGLVASGCSSNIRLYRYKKGHSFGPHIDESHTMSDGLTKFTILIYLNSSSGHEETLTSTISDSSKASRCL